MSNSVTHWKRRPQTDDAKRRKQQRKAACMDTDPDYGAQQRADKLYNERLFINWRADAKPVYRPRVRVIVAIMVTWTVCFLTWWYLAH